jgi:hypothetical protein
MLLSTEKDPDPKGERIRAFLALDSPKARTYGFAARN